MTDLSLQWPDPNLGSDLDAHRTDFVSVLDDENILNKKQLRDYAALPFQWNLRGT